MMLAATSDGQILIYLAFAIYGVYAWWQEGRKKKEAEELEKRLRENGQLTAGPSEGPVKPIPPARSPAPTGETTEQERLRRFLEALGVPAGAPQQPAPAPPSPRPKPIAPPFQPVSRPAYQPPPVVVRPAVSPARPVLRPVVEPEPRESMRPGYGGALSEVEEKVKTFEEAAALPSRLRPVAPPEQLVALALATADVRVLMRSPHTLRAAIVLREILGPPPGL